MRANIIQRHFSEDPCLMSPHPELLRQIRTELNSATIAELRPIPRTSWIHRRNPGMNDGLIRPGATFPLGTPLSTIRRAALDRPRFRGSLRLLIVLVDFEDRQFEPTHDRDAIRKLFFSTKGIPTGSVREYYRDVSRGAIDLEGEVVGPYRAPLTLREYAGEAYGISEEFPNARTLARDVAALVSKDVSFSLFDQAGDGYVDALVVVHAGRGAESTGQVSDLWSHKHVLPGGPVPDRGTQIYAYMMVPEDAHIGVCCHELGHLLFGWPDLYDDDFSSAGLASWCLMGIGSWAGNGDSPVHPSAWCKMTQGWSEVACPKRNFSATIRDVKNGGMIYRLWKDGERGSEYFLIENRQKSGFDRHLPGEGLLIYHIDESVEQNSNEHHPMVALMQADGMDELDDRREIGDQGDAFPGSNNLRAFNANTSPSSRSYAGLKSGVRISRISDPAETMTAYLAVKERSSSKEQEPAGSTPRNGHEVTVPVHD